MTAPRLHTTYLKASRDADDWCRIMDLARITGHRNYNSLQLYYNTTADELADRL